MSIESNSEKEGRGASPIPRKAFVYLGVVLLLDGLLAGPVIEGWRSGQLQHGVVLLFLPFNLFALGWVLEILSHWLRGRPLEPEGLHFGRDGDLEWAEFRRLGPIKFSLGLLFAISFLLALFALRVPNEYLGRLWIALLVIGFALWAGKAVLNLRRARRYGYSPSADLLHLPGGEPISSASCELRIEERRSPRGDRVRARPVLSVREQGQVRDVPLPWSFGREESERFSDWLMELRSRSDR